MSYPAIARLHEWNAADTDTDPEEGWETVQPPRVLLPSHARAGIYLACCGSGRSTPAEHQVVETLDTDTDTDTAPGAALTVRHGFAVFAEVLRG